jgi:hypothetical protein
MHKSSADTLLQLNPVWVQLCVFEAWGRRTRFYRERRGD